MVTYFSDKVRQIQIFDECIMKIILIFMISKKSRQRKIFDRYRWMSISVRGTFLWNIVTLG